MKKNEWIRGRTKVKDISETVKERKGKWAGYVARMKNKRCTSEIIIIHTGIYIVNSIRHRILINIQTRSTSTFTRIAQDFKLATISAFLCIQCTYRPNQCVVPNGAHFRGVQEHGCTVRESVCCSIGVNCRA